jgi:protein-disulfide isomerase
LWTTVARRNQTTRRGGRAPSPRVLIGAAAVVAALIVVGIVLAVRGGSSETATTESSSTTATSAKALPQAAGVERLFAGIPQRGNQIGDPDAPAAMIEYVDIQCPYCAQFESEAMPPLIVKYVRTGKLFLELRPIASLGADSQRGRLAMIAAGLQGKFFQFTQLLYLNQGAENSGWVSDKLLRSAAASIDGVDVDQLVQDIDAQSVARQGADFDAQARAAAIAVTPTIYVGKNGGALRPVAPAFPGDDTTIARAIDAVLK